ncbi:hypothetical protein [Flavobacterium sp. XS2P14]|uniref:hypothetical protein n=1 Tax=Flavobacterium sp. XS2P14 TaxID=3401735 RepID=UPI003AAD420F
MIKEKKILLICKESFSFPLFFMAKKLLAEGNEVSAFFIHPEESFYNKCSYNENTYYNFKDNLPEVKLYDLKDFCRKFNSKPVIDYQYLESIEKEYTHFKNLNLQLTVSQLTTRHYHNRIYFDYSSFEQNLNFIEYGYKRVKEVLHECQPDVIIDTEDGELLRTILCEVAHKNKIPYITIDYPRFELYKIPTYCLGVKTEEFVKLKYQEFLLKKDSELKDEFDYVSNMRNQSHIMSKEFKGTSTSQYKADPLIPIIKNTLGKVFYFWNVFFKSGNYKKIIWSRIIYPNPLKYFLFYAKIDIKRQFLFRSRNFFENPVKDEQYVYMPLHLIPESTTFVKAPFYFNELFIIEQISKSLPIGCKLYVKEHQSMLGERSFQFYKKVKQFPNVRLVKFNYYDDPKPWIENAKGVITITGTGAYEAAMLGKKALVFGDVPFNLIEGITRIHSFEQLPELIASFGNVDNVKSCAAYLATIKSIGKEINLKFLISEGEAILRKQKKYTDEYDEQIDNLTSFFESAFNEYSERVIK